jgi:alpha-beta hydrolase superfamily lysophospholipase
MMWATVLAVVTALGAGPQPQTVTLTASDGGRIAADEYGRGADAVVLAHGAAFNKESWKPQAELLASKGHRVLAINFRGYGASTSGTDGKALYLDVLAAVRYLHDTGATTVSVVGASMGGGASGRAAVSARPGEIDRLLLLSPVSIEKPEDMKAGRFLYIASRDEPMAPGIQKQFDRAPQPKRIELLDGSGHAQNIFKTSQADRLTALIVGFLDRATDHN